MMPAVCEGCHPLARDARGDGNRVGGAGDVASGSGGSGDSSALPLVDRRHLLQWQAQIGPEVVARLLKKLLDRAPNDIATMIRAHEAGDFGALEEAAHSFKGSVMALGLTRLAKIAAVLQAVAAGREDASGLLICLQEAAEQTAVALRAEPDHQ